MKKIKTILTALLIAAAVCFSSCAAKDASSVVTRPLRTAYIYSVTGEPLDTIYHVNETYGRAPYRVLVTSEGNRVTLDNTTIIIK